MERTEADTGVDMKQFIRAQRVLTAVWIEVAQDEEVEGLTGQGVGDFIRITARTKEVWALLYRAWGRSRVV